MQASALPSIEEIPLWVLHSSHMSVELQCNIFLIVNYYIFHLFHQGFVHDSPRPLLIQALTRLKSV